MQNISYAFLIGFFVGICWGIVAATAAARAPEYALDEVQTITGTIVAEPDRRPLHTKYTLKLAGTSSKVLVSDYRNWPRYQYGDTVKATGILEKPGEIDGFRYDNYLSRFGIHTVMYQASLQKVATGTPSLKRYLYASKDWFEQQINGLYPEPHASFMAGLLTGSRKGIPKDLMAAFNTTGLTHIIAISGYNITIIIALITSVLFWVHPQYRVYPAITAIVIFTLFVGASAAVVRAAIMGILGLLALQVNRIANVRLTVLWTAFFMTAWNPLILLYDAGFQLSFLAVLGLIELAPLLDPLFQKIPNTLALRESLQMTIAAQITAVPLIVMLFGRVSLIAPIANVLVAPFIPIAMLFGTLGVALSIMVRPLGQLLASIGWLALEWILLVAQYMANIPYASLELRLPKWALVLYYALLIITIHTASRSWCQRAKAPAPS